MIDNSLLPIFLVIVIVCDNALNILLYWRNRRLHRDAKLYHSCITLTLSDPEMAHLQTLDTVRVQIIIEDEQAYRARTRLTIGGAHDLC